MKPAWLIPKKKPNTRKISTRNVVKKHLKEWNMDRPMTKKEVREMYMDNIREDEMDGNRKWTKKEIEGHMQLADMSWAENEGAGR